MIEFEDMYIKDFGPLGEVTMPLRRQGAVLICGDNRDTTAADSNGAGKTHLFKGLGWGLFGDSIEGDRTDEVIRRGAKKAEVRIRFRMDGSMYEVERTRAKGAVTLALRKDGSPVGGAVVKETQAKIIELLGLDFTTFKNTVLFGQGDTAHFASPLVGDADRKNILKRILRLEVMDRALKVVTTRRSAATKAIAESRQRAEVREASLGAYDTEAIQTRLDQLKTDRDAAAKEQAKRTKLTTLITQAEEVVEGFAPVRERLDDAKRVEREAGERAASLVGDLRAAEAALSAVQGRKPMSTDLMVALTERTRLARALSNFAGGKCPTCEAPAGEGHLKEHMEGLRAEQAQVEADIERLTTEAQAVLDAEVAAAAKKVQDLRASHRAALDLRKAAQDGVQRHTDELEDEPRIRERLSEMQGMLKALDGVPARLKSLDAAIKEQNARLAKAVEEREAVEAEVNKLRADALAHEVEVRHLDFWVRGFGNSGLPSFIMDAIVPTLTERANRYLHILSDGDIKVRFDTESALKSGEVRDRFAVVPDIEGTGDTRASGGQLRKLLLATDLALMSYVADRERAAIDLLLLDEVLDGLDASGKARVIDLLMELRKTRSSIFVISHDPTLAEMFERRFTVVKSGGKSRLEVE